MQILSADTVCVLPIVQTVVGVCTFLSNMIKVIYDLARALFTNTWKGDNELYEKREKAVGTPDENQFNQNILSLPGYQFEQHVLYMCIGLIRAVPVIGTAYSLAVLYDKIQMIPVLDDPRWPEEDPRHCIPLA